MSTFTFAHIFLRFINFHPLTLSCIIFSSISVFNFWLDSITFALSCSYIFAASFAENQWTTGQDEKFSLKHDIIPDIMISKLCRGLIADPCKYESDKL